MTSMKFSTSLLYIHEGMNLIAHFSDSSHSLQISLNSSCVVEGLLPEDEEVRGCIPTSTMLQERIFIAEINLRQSDSLILKPHHVHYKIMKQKMFLYTHEHSTCLDFYLT